MECRRCHRSDYSWQTTEARLADIKNQITIDITEDGVRRRALCVLADSFREMPNPVALEGHTDATGQKDGPNGNWKPSTCSSPWAPWRRPRLTSSSPNASACPTACCGWRRRRGRSRACARPWRTSGHRCGRAMGAAWPRSAKAAGVRAASSACPSKRPWRSSRGPGGGTGVGSSGAGPGAWV